MDNKTIARELLALATKLIATPDSPAEYKLTATVPAWSYNVYSSKGVNIDNLGRSTLAQGTSLWGCNPAANIGGPKGYWIVFTSSGANPSGMLLTEADYHDHVEHAD